METKYTMREILTNIHKLNEKIDLMKRERTALTKSINSLKKQVDEWEEMNEDQLRIPTS